MPDVNADYDRVDSFHVYPDDLVTHGNNIKDHNQTVADSLTNIVNVLSDLHLGWAGKTSQEAKDFGDKWDAVAEELFGTKDHPEKGVLNAIAGGVLTVADLFSKTEHTLADFFDKFSQALTGGGSEHTLADLFDKLSQALTGGGGSDTPPQSITDVTTTAVTEQW
jgi:uncharacterized protein YukE